MIERRTPHHGLELAGDLVPAARRRDERDHMMPMIGIAFLLLIFFLIAVTLRVSDPPTIAPFQIVSERAIPSGSPILAVQSDGSMSFDSITVPSAAVPEIARRMAGNAPDATLYIKADGDTPASIILPLLKTLRNKGIESVRMIRINTELTE